MLTELLENIFLKKYKFVHMKLNERDEYTRRKEVCTNLFARLTNVFKALQFSLSVEIRAITWHGWSFYVLFYTTW